MFKITESGESNVINDSGEYTPTFHAPGTNITAATAEPCQWLRVGDRVIVSGSITIDPVAAATLTIANISLPVATDFTVFGQCSGVAFNNLIAGPGAVIQGDTTDNEAQIVYTPSDATSKRLMFIFMYQVR